MDREFVLSYWVLLCGLTILLNLQGRIQFSIDALDRAVTFSEAEVIIDHFAINLEVQPGPYFTTRTTYTGIYNIPGLEFDMSFRVQCSENYHGPNCNRCLTGRDIATNCITCLPGYDPSTNCAQCVDGRDITTACTTCLPGYDPSTNCAQCLNGRDIITACTTCLPGYDPSVNCTRCVAGRDITTTCITCLPSYDPSTNCTQCVAGRDITTACTTCLPGYQPIQTTVFVTTTSSKLACITMFLKVLQ